VDPSELAPIATLVVASVALYVGLRTIRQRDLADRRDQWWKRYQWATDLTLGQDEHARRMGLEVLELLGQSRLAGAEEIELLEAGMTAELSRRPDLLDDGWVEGHHGGHDLAQDDTRSSDG
jgi:hypothetical protein